MRVLISGALAGGGVGTHVKSLSRVLRTEGVDVVLCGTNCQWSQLELSEIRDLGIEIYMPVISRVEALIKWPFNMWHRFDVCCCIGHGHLHDLMLSMLK